MRTTESRLLHGDAGAGLVEYVLLIALIALIGVVSVEQFGRRIGVAGQVVGSCAEGAAFCEVWSALALTTQGLIEDETDPSE